MIVYSKGGNSTSDGQKEIGDKLLERYDKNLDRFISLIPIIFVILGFYSSIIIQYGILEKLANQITNQKNLLFSPLVYSIFSFVVCFASILFAILMLVSQIKIEEHRFKTKDGLIQFREGEELEKHNWDLFSSIGKQTGSYIISILFITCSLLSFLEYILLQDPTQQQGINFIINTILFYLIVIVFTICTLQLLHLIILNKFLNSNSVKLITCLLLFAFNCIRLQDPIQQQGINFIINTIIWIIIIITFLSMIYGERNSNKDNFITLIGRGVFGREVYGREVFDNGTLIGSALVVYLFLSYVQYYLW